MLPLLVPLYAGTAVFVTQRGFAAGKNAVSENGPAPCPGKTSLCDGGDACHEHIVHAGGSLLRVLPGAPLVDGGRVKEAQVRVGAWLDAALFGKTQPVGGEPGDLADRLGQRQHSAAADVGLQQPGECAVHPGVGQALGGIGGVGDDRGEGDTEDVRNVLFVGDEVDHGRAAGLPLQQVEQGVEGVLILQVCDLGDGLALQGQVLRAVQTGGQDVVEAHQQRDVFKVRAGFHPLPHGRPAGRVAQRRRQGIGAARLYLRRQYVDELGGAGGVGVHIAGDVHALLPGPGQQVQHFGHGPAPVAPADGLQVADFHRGLQCPGHSEHLLQRLHDAVALLAHVDGDGPAGPAQGSEGAQQPVGIVKALRRVPQAQGDAQSPVGEGLLQEGVERMKLLLCQRTGVKACRAAPQCAHAHQHARVERAEGRACLGAVIGQGGEPVPGGHFSHDGAQIVQHRPAVGAIHRRERQSAVAVDEGGQALGQLRLAEARGEQRRVRVAVQVDEAGGQGPPGGIDGMAGGRAVQVSHSGNGAAGDAHVGGIYIGAGAIRHGGVSDQVIKHGKRSFPRQCSTGALAAQGTKKEDARRRPLLIMCGMAQSAHRPAVMMAME